MATAEPMTVALPGELREEPAAHRGLVIKWVTRYQRFGVPRKDLEEEAEAALIVACALFDRSRGHQFSTYASSLIQNRLRDAVRQQFVVRVPEKLVRAIKRGLTAEAPGLKTEDRCRVASGTAVMGMSWIRDSELEGAGLAGMVAGRENPLVDEGRDDRVEAALEAIESLPGRETEVIRRRFGLGGLPKEGLAEIGASLGITKERVRQIEGAALRKLRLRLGAKIEG